MKKLIAVLAFATIIASCESKKTGFVDTQKIFKEYTETIEVRDKYSKLNDEFQSELEMKAKSFQIKLDLYQKNVGSMSASERKEKEEELQMLSNNIQREQQDRGLKLQQESDVAMDSLVTKVKDYIKSYGEENGYDYIYSQSNGNGVIYGKVEYDLTEEILDKLNAAYTPEK